MGGVLSKARLNDLTSLVEKVERGKLIKKEREKESNSRSLQAMSDGSEIDEEKEGEDKEETEETLFESESLLSLGKEAYPDLFSRCGVVPLKAEGRVRGMLQAFFRAVSKRLVKLHKKAFKLKRKVRCGEISLMVFPFQKKKEKKKKKKKKSTV